MAYLAKYGWTYDVFLLHAGEDEKIMTDLYNRLCNKGILPFFDKKTLNRGDNADPKIMDALKTSRFVVPIVTQQLIGKRWPEMEMQDALKRQKPDLPHAGDVIKPAFFVDPDELLRLSLTGSIHKICRITGQKRENLSNEDFLTSLCEAMEHDVKNDAVQYSDHADRPDDEQHTSKVDGGTGGDDQNSSDASLDFGPLSKEDRDEIKEAEQGFVSAIAGYYRQQCVQEHKLTLTKCEEEIKSKTTSTGTASSSSKVEHERPLGIVSINMQTTGVTVGIKNASAGVKEESLLATPSNVTISTVANQELTLAVLCADEGADGYPEKVITELKAKGCRCERLPKFDRELPEGQCEISLEPWREEISSCVRECVCLLWIVTEAFWKQWKEDVSSNGQFPFQNCVRDVLNVFHAKYRQDDNISTNRILTISKSVSQKDIRTICAVCGAANPVDGSKFSTAAIADVVRNKASDIQRQVLLRNSQQ